MKKTIIIYASKHHGNTRKFVNAISERFDISLINAEKESLADLSQYDLIGFASGIDFGRFYPSVEEFMKNNLPEDKQIFLLYTCAKPNQKATKSMRDAAHKKSAVILGEYGCRGFNTYGPWKLIGGMNKHHPTTDELNGAISFFQSLLTE